MGKMSELSKKSVQIEAVVQSRQAVEEVMGLKQLLGEFAGASAQLEGTVKDLHRSTSFTEFRVLALIDLLTAAGIIDMKKLAEKISEVSFRWFEQASAEEDAAGGLVSVTDEPAAEGMTAIFTMRVYDKDGNYLEKQSTPRSRIVIGATPADLLEEVDFALTGMKIGETVSLNFTMAGQEVTAGIELLGLRKKLPTAPPRPDGE